MQIDVSSGCLYIRGDVDVQSLTRAKYSEFIGQIKQPEITSIDFGSVKKADSVCVSLLLSACRERGLNQLTILALPTGVCDLAKLYEVDEWLKM